MEVTGKCSGKIFYFSTQTFTTAGYGHVYPVVDAAEIVAVLEELKVFFRLQLQLV
ncbi:MAG: two pore domain potassium channel family protein [Ferruginibacter sp.]|nr:two pore domain potassium channel family protein [Ferruginibacter sp.]